LAENAFLWSVTASSNDVADPAVPWPEGMLPGAVNNSARATMAGVARLIADINGTITTGGTAGSYSVTSNSAHTALTNGILLTVKASATNTAAATLNMNTLGAKSIRVRTAGAEAAIAAGQMVINGTYQFRYDTAANTAAGGWILLNPETDPTLLLTAGSIKIWPSDTLETGWLWANGASLLRSDYPALFTAISTTFGAADGTHFNVPDLCGRAPYGSDDMGAITAKGRITNAGSGIVGTTLGASGGTESITLNTTQIPSHSHTGTVDSGGVDHNHSVTGFGSDSVSHHHSYDTALVFTGGFTGPTGSGWSNSTSKSSGEENQDHTHSVTIGLSSAYLHTHTFTTARPAAASLTTTCRLRSSSILQ
jgi:microcystin-dependent protein